MLGFRLIAHFTGNILVWIINLGRKSIDEVSEKDNSTIGLIVLIFAVIIFYKIQM